MSGAGAFLNGAGAFLSGAGAFLSGAGVFCCLEPEPTFLTLTSHCTQLLIKLKRIITNKKFEPSFKANGILKSQSQSRPKNDTVPCIYVYCNVNCTYMHLYTPWNWKENFKTKFRCERHLGEAISQDSTNLGKHVLAIFVYIYTYILYTVYIGICISLCDPP